MLTVRSTSQGVRLALVAGALTMAYEVIQMMYIDLHWLLPAYFLL